VLDFITQWVQDQGYPPTFQELAHSLDLTEKNARDYVLILERKGYLRRQPNVARGLTLLKPAASEPFHELPLVGRVMAGKPVEVFEHHETILIPPWLLRGGTHFVVEVRGESMIDDGIREGDLVIVQQQVAPSNGDTVVAVVHGEATIKRFFRHGAMVELRPANAQMASLQVDAQDVEVKGVVAGLLRKYS
jgi:repressor LexA